MTAPAPASAPVSDCPGASPATGLPLLLVAAAALVDADGRILVAQRPPGKPLAGLWEFPGGKLEPGEPPETALIRELAEELGIDVSASCLAPLGFASHALDHAHLVLLLFACRRWAGTPHGQQGQPLKWCRVPDLFSLAMPPADRPLLGLLDALI